MEGWVRLSADLRDISGKLRESFEKEQSPDGNLDDAGLWTVLKAAEEEYGVELEPLVAQLTEKQRGAGAKLRLSYVQFVEVMKEYVNRKTKEGWGRRGKEEKKLPEQTETMKQETDLQPSGSFSPANPSESQIASSPLFSHQKFTSLANRQRSLSPTHPSIPPSQSKSAESILSNWQSHLEEIKVIYNSQGPMKTIEAISSQIGLKWSPESAGRFQEMMGKRSDDCEEQGDVFGLVFWPSVEEWTRSHPAVQGKLGLSPNEQLTARLKMTIKEVESIGKVQELAGQDSSQSQQLLSTLRSQLRRIEASAAQQGEEPVFLQRCKAGIHEIYTFYVKQTKIKGPKPSFDDILHSISVLSSGKFLKFLMDFQILENSRISTRKVIDQATALSIFRQTALFHKDMNEAQFTMALDLVALAYFDHEFDRLNRTDWASCTMAEKREKLYRSLGLDQESKYREKLKGYAVPLAYSEYRPEDDPAKRYKHRVAKQQNVTLERWRQRMRNPSIDSAPRIGETHAKSLSKPRNATIMSKQASMRDIPGLDSSDFDLNDILDSSDSSPPSVHPLAKSTASLFASSKTGKGLSRAETLQKAGLAQETEAVAKALKAANAQMEKGQRVAKRVEAAAAKYKD